MSEIKFKFTPDDGRFKKLKFRLGLVCCQLCRFASMERSERENYCRYCVITGTMRKVFDEIIDIARLTVTPDGEKKCNLCSLKPVFDEDGEYEPWESQIELVCGSYIELCMVAKEDGRFAIYACGEDKTKEYPINFCPKCGRKLQMDTDKGEKA